MPSIWGPPHSKKPKARGYESNATQLLQATPSARALQSARVAAEVRMAKKTGRLPTAEEVQERYPFTSEAAEKLIRATKRALAARSKVAAHPAASRQAVGEGQPEAEPPAATHPGPSSDHLKAVLADIRRRFGEEIRQLGEQTSVAEGFVYLVTHPCFAGWVKAGMTIDYEVRLGTYNVSDPLSRFELQAVRWVANRRATETKLLLKLALSAVETRGEWFRMPLEAATSALTALRDEE